MPDELIPVRILRPFGAYAPGEIAGFVQAKVAEFVKANAVEVVMVNESGEVVEPVAEVAEETLEEAEAVNTSRGRRK